MHWVGGPGHFAMALPVIFDSTFLNQVGRQSCLEHQHRSLLT